MGEVYRAADTKLKREVVIKVLPSQFASDPSRLARFEWEAQAMASLNHPNIAGGHCGPLNAASVGPDSPRGRRLGPEGEKTVAVLMFGSIRTPTKQFCISSQF